MQDHRDTIESSARTATTREGLWCSLVSGLSVVTAVELGVQRGIFASAVLAACPGIETYYMVDPWRYLEGWLKPANKTDAECAAFKRAALAATEFASGRRIILEGTTLEVRTRIPDDSIDFAYVDGDHTLRGITLDLLSIWPKLRHGALLGGDDFSETIWQHRPEFEPTLVFPMAVHFAEAMGCIIYGLPLNQFAIVVDKSGTGTFQFVDLTGKYARTDLRQYIMSRASPAQK